MTYILFLLHEQHLIFTTDIEMVKQNYIPPSLLHFQFRPGVQVDPLQMSSESCFHSVPVSKYAQGFPCHLSFPVGLGGRERTVITMLENATRESMGMPLRHYPEFLPVGGSSVQGINHARCRMHRPVMPQEGVLQEQHPIIQRLVGKEKFGHARARYIGLHFQTITSITMSLFLFPKSSDHFVLCSERFVSTKHS